METARQELRCCARIPNEFAPSYASVLVHGTDGCGLRDAVISLETGQTITSCFTAWCPQCLDTSMVVTDLQAFPAPSAHHTHQLALLAVLQRAGVYFQRSRTEHASDQPDAP
jgi:hypothetical protein